MSDEILDLCFGAEPCVRKTALSNFVAPAGDVQKLAGILTAVVQVETAYFVATATIERLRPEQFVTSTNVPPEC